MEDYLKGGFQYYYKLYKDGEVVCYKVLNGIADYLAEQGFVVDFETIKHYAYLQKEFNGGYKIVRTDEKKFNVFTIDYKGKTYTGTSKELADKLGIDRGSITVRHNARCERVAKAELKERQEKERLHDVIEMIKYQVSLPPCYKTFYHLSSDDEIIKRLLGDEYKFTHIKNKKEGWNYWEITYADI